MSNMQTTLSDDTNLESVLYRRKLKSQNIIHTLRERELFGNRTKSGTDKRFYLNIFPNFTVVNISTPPCFLRKFSPDGRLVIAYSFDQTSLEIYRYNGPSALNGLLNDFRNDDFIGEEDQSEPVTFIRTVAFERFFTLVNIIKVTEGEELLNRECSLFTDDSQYVIVGSNSLILDEQRPNFYRIYSNNEAVSLSSRSPIENYSIHLIDLKHGRLCDTRKLACDKIFMSHNQGMYLYRNTLAVLSVQHQTIYTFHVGDGRITPAREIGRFCYEDDALQVQLLASDRATHAQLARPYREKTINSLKHKILVHLFMKAHASGNAARVRTFFQLFDYHKSLRMWRMQLLDEDHLLIKYSAEDVVTMKAPEPNCRHAYFVFYRMSTCEVLAVQSNSSAELLRTFEWFSDYFRNTILFQQADKVAAAHQTQIGVFTTSASNNMYAQACEEKYKQTFLSARHGGTVKTTKHMLAHLPISAQSFSASPYLDVSLFSFDDKCISSFERPKICHVYPIRFYSRESGLYKFRIHTGNSRLHSEKCRRLVAFTFHPRDPFAISIQRANLEYIVNVHVRLA